MRRIKRYVNSSHLVIARAVGLWQSRRPFTLPWRLGSLNRRMDCHGATRLAMTRWDDAQGRGIPTFPPDKGGSRGVLKAVPFTNCPNPAIAPKPTCKGQRPVAFPVRPLEKPRRCVAMTRWRKFAPCRMVMRARGRCCCAYEMGAKRLTS
jgi:hypothetical protein